MTLLSDYRSRFVDTFLASVERLRSGITVEMAEAALGFNYAAIDALIDELRIAKAEDTVFAEIVAQAATMALGSRELREAMTVQSPFVQEVARKLTANLVTGVTAETKAAIREVIFDSIRNGHPPAVAQKTLRQIVGLTRRDALAVAKLAESLTPAALDRYAARLLKQRATLIARTEILRAGNMGRVAGWKEMARRGLLDTSRFRERWVVTNDDRLCPQCAPMEGKVVRLGGTFEETERGVLPSERVPVAGVTVESPPLHPGCRCTLVADFEEAGG